MLMIKNFARGLFRDKIAQCPRRIHTSVTNEIANKTDGNAKDEDHKRRKKARTCPFENVPNLIERLGILCACSTIILGFNVHPCWHSRERRTCSYKFDWSVLNRFIARCLNPIPGVLPKAPSLPTVYSLGPTKKQVSIDDGYVSVGEGKAEDDLKPDNKLSRLYKEIVRESDEYSATFCNVFGVSLIKSGDVTNGVKWLKRSGNQESLFNLGIVYEKGMHNADRTADVGLALSCYERAAKLGHKSAAHNLLILLKKEINAQRKELSKSSSTSQSNQSHTPKFSRTRSEASFEQQEFEQPRCVQMYGVDVPVATLAMPSLC